MSAFTPNPGQTLAIQARVDMPVRVVACAGTGKTEVIARRFVYLLQQNKKLRPDNILVLTFSEKAAAEMRARIFNTVTQARLGFDRLDLSAASISTFHSFGMRLLHEHSLAARVDPNLPVLTPVDVQEFLDEAQKRFLEEGYREAYGDVNPLDLGTYTWEDGGPFPTAQQILEQLRNQAVEPEVFRRNVLDRATPSEAHRTLAPLVHWIYSAYRDELRERGQLDFDQLIVGAVALLEADPILCQQLRDQYRVILVDEYQDTNYAQNRLLRAIAAEGMRNVTVVGDPRQAIYVWREARVDNIAEFPAPNLPRNDRPLTENRRSLLPILEAANRGIAGYEFGPVQDFDPEDQLCPSSDNERFSGIVVDLIAKPDRQEESATVAKWIAHIVTAEQYHYSDIAILIRARTFLGQYTTALRQAGIPYLVSAQDAFFTRPEVVDAVHLLHVCIDPADDLSLVRVLLSPAIGFNQDQVAALATRRNNGQRLWSVVNEGQGSTTDSTISAGLERLVKFWKEARAEHWLVSLSSFVDWALRLSGLAAIPDPMAQRALAKLQAIVHEYESAHPAETLRDLVTYLQLTLATDPRTKAPELNTKPDAVRILTTHASKGLEFPVVIAADSRQKVRPNRSLAPFHEPEAGLVIPAENETHPVFLERMRRARNEARCLWYVTCTRPKKRLILTATNKKERLDNRFQKVDTFFEELWNQQVENPLPGVALDRAPSVVTTVTPGSSAAPEEQPYSERPKLAQHKPEFHISPTAFRWYQQCPAAYRFHYRMGYGWLKEEIQREEERVEGHATGRKIGSVFHRAVALHARRNHASARELLDAAVRELSAQLNPTQTSMLAEWIDKYLVSELGLVPPAPPAVEARVSLSLEFECGAVTVFGVADRLEPERLIDYKTDASAEGLVERHADQLRLYALAARRAGLLRQDAALSIYHAATANLLPVSLSSLDETKLYDQLSNLAAVLADVDGAFPAVKSDLCQWCKAKGAVCRD